MAESEVSNPVQTDTQQPSAPPRRRVRHIIGRILTFPIFALLIAWGTLAIYYSNAPSWMRPVLSGIFALGSLAIVILIRNRLRRLVSFAALFGAVVLWWMLIPASNDRDWQPDLAVLPWAQLDGDQLIFHNIRNCDYRSESDFDVRYYDRTFDLRKLRAADLFVVTWGSPHIAHTMMSFVFDDDQYLCFSIETRKEKGEGYSVIKGFFKQFELMYVAADERDLVRLRTNFRGEQVRIYRAKAPPEVCRAVLQGYIRSMNKLREKPEWYNALTSNCLTNVRGHTVTYAENKHWDWRFLLNGHLDELMYERKTIDTSLPFAEMKEKSLVNEKAKVAANDGKWSKTIRDGLPGM